MTEPRASSLVSTITALVLIVEAGALLRLGAAFPATPAPVDPALPLAPQIERVEHELLARLPPLAERFAWSPLRSYSDARRAALAAGDDPQRTAERVAWFNRIVRRIREHYVGTVVLLVAALLAGASALLLTARRGPSPASLLAPLAGCLAVTPIITEPLIGSDFGASLLPFVLPMMIGGGVVLLRERAAFRPSASRLGGLLARDPAALMLASALILGALGGACLTLAVDEQLGVLTPIGAVCVAHAVVQFVVAAGVAVRRLVGRR